MSVEFLTWAFKQRLDDSGAKFVLVALCNYANPINPCDKSLMGIIPETLRGHIGQLGFSWPSQEQLSSMTGMVDRSVRRHLITLEGLDLILRFERRRPDGRKSSTGYLLITSPDILSASTSPDNFDTTSPDKLSATYEDTQGLIQKDGIITTPDPSVNKLPLPLFRILSVLDDRALAAVRAEAATRTGQPLSVTYLAQQYDAWVAHRSLVPRHPLPHFLDFIRRHKERNKL